MRMQAIATKSRPKKTFAPLSVTSPVGSMASTQAPTDAASSTTAPENLKPRPDSVRVPRMRPTQAQAAPIASAYLAPSDSPAIERAGRQRLALQPVVAEAARDHRDVRADDAQHDAPERREERRVVEQQHRDQRDQREHEVPALADHARELRDLVRLDAREPEPLRLEVHHRQAGDVVEQRGHDRDEHEQLVGHAEQFGHHERGRAHHRRRHLAAAGRGGLDRAGEARREAVLLHHRDGQRAGRHRVGDGRARDHPEQARRHDARPSPARRSSAPRRWSRGP